MGSASLSFVHKGWECAMGEEGRGGPKNGSPRSLSPFLSNWDLIGCVCESARPAVHVQNCRLGRAASW